MKLAALWLLLGASLAQDPPPPWEKAFFESEPKEILAAAKEIKTEPGTPVVQLLAETRFTFQADGRSESRVRQVYRVLTDEAARDWGVVQADWALWYQERPVLRARVISPDGQAHALEPKTLSEKPVASGTPDVFTDRRSLTGPLPSMSAGAVVELETVIRETRPFFESGVVTYHHFGGETPLRRERLILDAPEGLALKPLTRLLPDVTPRRESADGRTVLTYEKGPMAPREGFEPLLPSDVPMGPYVAFTTGKSWSLVAQQYHRIVEAQIGSADLKGLGELPAKDLPRPERIARLLSLIHTRVRYTSLALGDASIVPRPPGETLQRGYGDCKDKAALLVAALRRVGIDAQVAVLLTGPGVDVEPDLPGFGSFNHAIVHVSGEPELWIDATDKFSRAGSLPLQDQDRRILIADPGTVSLARTPASAPRDNVDLKIREIQLADYGPARLVETLRPTGHAERKLRGLLDQDRKGVEQSLTSYVTSVFGAPKLSTWSAVEASDLSKPFELKIEAADVARGQTDLREAVVAIAVENLFVDLPWFFREPEGEEKPDKPEKPARTHDVCLYAPTVSEWRYRIIPPPGFQARPFPANEKLALGPATLEKAFSRLEDGSVSVLLRFDCGKRRMTAEEAKQLRQGVERVRAEGVLLVGFSQVGAAHLEAGRIKEALGEFRTLAEAHPKKAVHRAQIARALLAGALGDAARVEARKAVELEPDSFVARQTLAWILQHDLIGRRFEKGWDPKGAEEAYRGALKIKPGQLEFVLDLAIMLEHDAAGQRYTSGSRLGEAIDLYKSVLKQIEGTNFENNLNVALLWAGRFKELGERLRKTTTPSGRALVVVARSALEGADAGLAYAARSIPDEETRRASLAQAGELLLKLRYYAESGALLAAAARGAEDAASMLGRADRTRKTRKWDAFPEDASDASSAVKRLMFLVMAPNFDAAAVGALMSRYTVDPGKDASTRDIRMMRTVIEEMWKKQSIAMEVGRDLTLSLMEPVVEGDEGLGYRVRVPSVFGGRTPQLWFLHPEDGRLKLLTLGEGAIGRLALDLLEAGDADRARKWLDWAADELPDGADRDPLEADPFAVLYKKGQEADVTALRRAAAALAAEGARSGAAIAVLEEARGEEKNPKRRFVYDHAIAQAYGHDGKWVESGTASTRMIAAEPDSNAAFFLRGRSLEKQHKFDDMAALCQAQLRLKPNNAALLHALQHVESMRGKQESSQEYGRRLVKLGQGSPGVYNNLAWASLLEGKVTAVTLQDAQKATSNASGRSDAALHTLATVYADLGRPAEARDVLLQTFRARLTTEPEPQDWYVLGRIAEEYGAKDAAIAAYRRTATAENADLPNSTNQLSLRRLRGLEEK
jgi:tetratricopeptide (TPR) repeat protein